VPKSIFGSLQHGEIDKIPGMSTQKWAFACGMIGEHPCSNWYSSIFFGGSSTFKQMKKNRAVGAFSPTYRGCYH